MGESKIFEWTSPVDPGPPPTERTFGSPPIPLNWTHLSVRCTPNMLWAGSLQIRPIQQIFFNRFPQPAPPFTADLPNQSYVTQTGDFLFLTTVNGPANPGLSVFVELFGDPLPVQAECAYGTEPKDGTVFFLILTAEILAVALAEVGMSWLGFFLSAFIGTTIQVGGLCASLPPAMPAIDGSFFTASLETKKKLLDVILWSHFCQCKPGTPAPVPVPPPFAPQPPGLVLPPTPSCAETDLCAQVVLIRQQLAALSSTLSAVADVTTVTQRFHVPFEWIEGPTHPGLTEEGSFATSRMLGVRVTVTAKPEAPILRGNPDYQFNLGWLAIVDGTEQLLTEVRLTRLQQIWLPPLFAAAARFTWSLYPDVVINVTELYAEP